MLPFPGVYLCGYVEFPGPQSGSPAIYTLYAWESWSSFGALLLVEFGETGLQHLFRERPSILFHSCGFVYLNNVSWYKRLDHEIAHRIPGSCCPTLQAADALQACWAWPNRGILPNRKHYWSSKQTF